MSHIKHHISPLQYHTDIMKLCSMIPKNKYKYIYGIPTGCYPILTYVHKQCGLEIKTELKTNELENLKNKILIIDDLLDTGITLQKFYNLKFDIAVLYYKLRSTVIPTYYVQQIISNDQWIVFPYDNPQESPNRDI